MAHVLLNCPECLGPADACFCPANETHMQRSSPLHLAIDVVMSVITALAPLMLLAAVAYVAGRLLLFR